MNIPIISVFVIFLIMNSCSLSIILVILNKTYKGVVLLFNIEKHSEISNEDGILMAKCTANVPSNPMSVYSFNVDGILIDTGSSSLVNEFKPYFDQADFDAIYLTHFHEDHVGNVSYLQQQSNTPTFIHQMSTHLTTKPFRIPTYRQAVWGECKPFTSQALGDSFTSRHHTWEVVETPGHTKDHVAFYNRDLGAMFTGDLFITPKVKLVLVDENILETLDSLKKLQAYDFNDMYCCHAGHVKDAKKWIQLKIDYLEQLQGKVLDLAQQGKDVHEITAQLFPNTYPIIAVSNTEWSPLHMIRTFMNHG